MNVLEYIRTTLEKVVHRAGRNSQEGFRATRNAARTITTRINVDPAFFLQQPPPKYGGRKAFPTVERLAELPPAEVRTAFSKLLFRYQTYPPRIVSVRVHQIKDTVDISGTPSRRILFAASWRDAKQGLSS